MAKTRWYFHKLKAYDRDNHTSIVRELEMEADLCIKLRGYVPQFWRDAEVYGVDEAITYVESNKAGDFTKLRAAWEVIKARISKEVTNG